MASQTLGESTESLALSLRQPEVARLIIIDIYDIDWLNFWCTPCKIPKVNLDNFRVNFGRLPQYLGRLTQYSGHLS